MKKNYVIPNFRVLPIESTNLMASSIPEPAAVPPTSIDLNDEINADEIG